jgi:alkanesulfonate monooxygenase SsuD/methylene tetrahydromethanopterin reductase-like flavin-dependent oxidoreductase (luciferase family)
VDNYSLPETARFRQIHDGHCTFLQPEERRFITPEAIAAVCVVGTPEEIIHKLHAMEKAGIKEIALLPPADYQRKIFRGIAEMIFPAFR